MALKAGSEKYTMFTYAENGKVMNRRMHRVEIQAADGRLFVLKGDKLPEFIAGFAGHAYKGEHTLQILLGNHPKKQFQPPNTLGVAGTVLVSAVFGIAVFMICNFLVDISSAGL